MPSEVIAYRGQYPETTHYIDWVVVDDSGSVITASHESPTELKTWIRSTAKPFQAYVSSKYLPQITQPQLAISMASHAGTPEHLEIIQDFLSAYQLSVADLKCGPSYPVDGASRANLVQQKIPKSPLFHNCSGKHTGFLSACQCSGLDTRSYLDVEHPLQQQVIEEIKRFAPLLLSENIAVDGCGLPVFYLSLDTLAKMYASLVTASEYQGLVKAMKAYPQLIGGPLRIDTNIMLASEGKLIAKVGAEGLLTIAHCEKKQGLAFKVWDGSQVVRDISILELLVKLEWLREDQVQSLRSKLPVFSLERKNDAQKSIGHYQLKFE